MFIIDINFICAQPNDARRISRSARFVYLDYYFIVCEVLVGITYDIYACLHLTQIQLVKECE